MFSHRHIRFALFFHSLALIACIRKERGHNKDLEQVSLNQAFLRTWAGSTVNAGHWLVLVVSLSLFGTKNLTVLIDDISQDAESSSLDSGMEALQLYDEACRLCTNNDWVLEEGWAFFLMGSHLERCGVNGLGSDMMRRGINRQKAWGAWAIANYLTSMVDSRPMKRNTFTSSVGVQTEMAMITVPASEQSTQYAGSLLMPEEDDLGMLPASDLSNVLKWSKDIASEIHLSSGNVFLVSGVYII